MGADAVVGGVFVVLLWLCAIFYGRPGTPTYGLDPPPHFVRTWKALLVGLAVFSTIVYALLTLVTVLRRVAS